MNNFWTLVKYEHKKIFMRKSVVVGIVISIILTIILACINIIGTNYESGINYYDEMLIDKQNQLALSGRKLDDNLIYEAVQAFAKVPQNSEAFTLTEEYEKFAKPYYTIYSIVDMAYTSKNNAFMMRDFANLTKEEVGKYYELRTTQYRTNLENNPLFTQRNVNRIIEIDKEVGKPFTIEYHEGYTRFFNMTMTTSILIMILIAYMVAPIFAAEYGSRIDSLILSSKNGKSTVIIAKIFTAIAINIIVTTMIFGVGYLACMIVYGFGGTNASIQNLISAITYNFTMLECTKMIFITTIIGGFLMSGVSLFLSSFMKSIVDFIICTGIVFIGISAIFPVEWFVKLRLFLPVAMGNFNDMITQISWTVLGVEVWLYQAVCIVGVMASTILIGFGYRNFKKHQVN